MNAELRDVGEERARRQNLSISQKYHIVESYENRGVHNWDEAREDDI